MTKRFVVEGSGHFPTDMLRYDACWPSSGDDSSRMIYMPGQGRSDRRKITLSTDSKYSPTIGRWNSFNWAVVED